MDINDVDDKTQMMSTDSPGSAEKFQTITSTDNCRGHACRDHRFGRMSGRDRW